MQADSTSPNPERAWTYPWETWEGVFWSVSYLAMVAFGYYTPLDVLDKYPEAKAFTDFMAGWNLQIQCVGEISFAVSGVSFINY